MPLLLVNKKILRVVAVVLMTYGCVQTCLSNEDSELAVFRRILPKSLNAILEEFSRPIKVRTFSSKNILIFNGEAGVGKTFLAQGCARETDSFLITISAGSLFSSGIMGSGSQAVENAFASALDHIQRTKKNVIILFEEIDAMAMQVGDLNGEARRAYQTFNTLADKYKQCANLLIIGTTNRVEQCAKEFMDRCHHIEIGPLSEFEQFTAFKSVLLNEMLWKIDSTLREFCDKIASLQKSVHDLLVEGCVLLLGQEKASVSRVNEIILESRRLVNGIKSEQVQKEFNRCVGALETSAMEGEGFDKRYKIIALLGTLDCLRERYVIPSGELCVILADTIAQVRNLNRCNRDEEGISIVDEFIRKIFGYISYKNGKIVNVMAKIFHKDLSAFMQRYKLCLDTKKFKDLLLGYENRSTRFLESLDLAITAHEKQEELTGDDIAEIRVYAEKLSPLPHKKSDNSSNLSLRDRLKRLGPAEMCQIIWLGKSGFELGRFARKKLPLGGEFVYPFALIVDQSSSLMSEIYKLYRAVHGGKKSPSSHTTDNDGFYRSKMEFLNEIDAIESRISASKNQYLDSMKQQVADDLQRTRFRFENAEKERQRIVEERKKIASETLELDAKIKRLNKELTSGKEQRPCVACRANQGVKKDDHC